MNCLSAYQSIYLSVYLSIYVRMSRLNRPLNLIDLATSASSKAIRHSSFSKLDGNKIAWFESPKSTTSPLSWSIKTISEEEEASIDWMAIDKLASANTKQVTSWIYKTAALDWKCAGNSHSLGTKPPTSNLMEVPWALSCISLFLSIRSRDFFLSLDRYSLACVCCTLGANRQAGICKRKARRGEGHTLFKCESSLSKLSSEQLSKSECSCPNSNPRLSLKPNIVSGVERTANGIRFCVF